MNSSYLEENGYWYSEQSGNWYQKVCRENNILKDKSEKFYGWELIQGKEALESLNLGFLPSDLEDQATYLGL